jgi:uncharacterized protein YeaO (DUF488 family)
MATVAGGGQFPSMLKTKSVHSEIEAGDGLRILVARFRGRGLPVDRYDVWMASLGPSERLLKGVLAGEITWREFSKRYREEIFAPATFDDANETIKNHGQKFTLRLLAKLAKERDVTLLCHCAEDATQCHRFLLWDLIEKEGK